MYHRKVCEICGYSTETETGRCVCNQNYFGDNKIHIDKKRSELHTIGKVFCKEINKLFKEESEKKMSANDHQVGGNHYRDGRDGIQHWDLAAARDYDYFQGQITKYIDRWKRKNGLQDLHKAKQFLEKYIEIETRKLETQGQAEMPLNDKRVPEKSARWTQEQMGPFGFDPKLDVK